MAWTRSKIVSSASRIYFVLILFQIPLFRIQCGSGMCTGPLQMASTQLISSKILPSVVVKALLYPGAILNGLFLNLTIPAWSDILAIYNLTETKNASSVIELQRLEVFAGSYFSIAGAIVGMLTPQRMSLFGTLLIVWGLLKEGFLNHPNEIIDPEKTLYIYPMFLITIICAFASIKYDVKKALRSNQARPVAKPLHSSLKSKLR